MFANIKQKKTQTKQNTQKFKANISLKKTQQRCERICRDPVESNCQNPHLFCKVCIDRKLNAKKECPICQWVFHNPGPFYTPKKHLKKTVLQLDAIVCLFENCDWLVEIFFCVIIFICFEFYFFIFQFWVETHILKQATDMTYIQNIGKKQKERDMQRIRRPHK